MALLSSARSPFALSHHNGENTAEFHSAKTRLAPIDKAVFCSTKPPLYCVAEVDVRDARIIFRQALESWEPLARCLISLVVALCFSLVKEAAENGK